MADQPVDSDRMMPDPRSPSDVAHSAGSRPKWLMWVILAFAGVVALALNWREQRTVPSLTVAVENEPAIEEIRPAEAASREENTARLVFDHGFGHEGVLANERAVGVAATFGGRRHQVTAGAPAYVDLPSLAEGWRRVSFSSPGWEPLEISFPPAKPGFDTIIRQRIELRRSTAAIALRMPEGGVDYDEAELVWMRPLDDEPDATPPKNSFRLALAFEGSSTIEAVPTGIYSLVLHGKHASRVKDFVVDGAVRCASSKGSPSDGRLSFSLPRSLSRRWVAFAGFAPDAGKGRPAAGMFCRLQLDVKAGTGDLAMAMQPLPADQALGFSDLKPRPDTVWPVSNVVLNDPTRIEFDCPFSHADHHFFLVAADGIVTLKGEMLQPETDPLREEMLGRMKSLIQEQARLAGQNRSQFDPAYATLPAQQLPNFAELSSPQNFLNHLRRVSRSPLTAIELGTSVTAHKNAGNSWDVKAVCAW